MSTGADANETKFYYELGGAQTTQQIKLVLSSATYRMFEEAARAWLCQKTIYINGNLVRHD